METGPSCTEPISDFFDPELLAGCYERSLDLADGAGLRSVAFPAISTGAFRYPMSDAARIALRTIAERAGALTSVRLIRFVLYRQGDLEVHRQALEEVLGP